MAEVFKLDLPSTDKFVLVAMADYAQDDGTRCYPSVAALARKTSLCERSVQYALRRLELAKLLIAQGVSNGRSTTTYIIAVENAAQGVLPGVQQVHPRVQIKTANPAPDAPNPLGTIIEPKKEPFLIPKTRKQQELESALRVGANPYRPSREWREAREKRA